MIPVLKPEDSLEGEYQHYLNSLQEAGFKGEVETRYASRLAVATDNSIYQKIPQAVVFPKDILDLQLIGTQAAKFSSVTFSPRGGGTGTNGQSLTDGVVVDLSRHMTQILEFNAEEGWVRVQTGLVKDALNDFLRPYGFFFAPDLSTSNRATIGGMINTDASGQGSLVYGKTSDHVLALSSVLIDGTRVDSEPHSVAHKFSDLRHEQIYKQLKDTCIGKRQLILDKFPQLNRFLTGYDLAHGVSDDLGHMDLSRILAGSEGSLAFIAEAKLNVTPIAPCKALVNIKYDSFESALRHATDMVEAKATSVETVDSKVLNLAMDDIVWHSISELIRPVEGKDILGLNIVEFNSQSQTQIEGKIAQLSQILNDQIAANQKGVIGYQITYDLSDIGKIYTMRKKAVGLLGKSNHWRKPIACVEDTAVPPENLADFILEFRDLLDSHQLEYGMFGHVDAGVLHVRPALDMCDPKDEALVNTLSDQVVALVAKYGGLMWGEHGKGYRSQYGPEFFGDELFDELRKIKQVFDPYNQMNPGKICTPLHSNASLVKVSDTKRGFFDKQIPISIRDSFEPALACNGNGLCFNYDTKSVMCPSSKITQDRQHSPKGRAGLMREWLRLLSQQGISIDDVERQTVVDGINPKYLHKADNFEQDFSHQVYEAMNGCLACKACAKQCPVNVDIPSFRARFLHFYHLRYKRPLKDYLVAHIEHVAPIMAKVPKFFNFFIRSNFTRNVLNTHIGYVDTPLLSSPSLAQRLKNQVNTSFDLARLSQLSQDDKEKHVFIVQDPFTSYYDAGAVEQLIQLVDKLGYTAILLPFHPNGKPQHVKGFLKKFQSTANTTAKFLQEVALLNIPMIGLDPSMVLCYRDEYAKVLKKKRGSFEVLMVNEWLESKLAEFAPISDHSASYVLFGHCTEKTAVPTSEKSWQAIFKHFGAQLDIQNVGCCGMAGTYGHESQNLHHSIGIYDMSWKTPINQLSQKNILVTGYSCRSQVARIEKFNPKHPVQALFTIINR